MTGLVRLWRVVWALPYTLVGLLLSPTFRRRRLRSGVLLCEGARWPGRMGWRYRAVTLGHVVLSVDELDPQTFAHELQHVRQYERLGPLFVPAYLGASLWARLHGGHHHRDNRFETQVRRRMETLQERGTGLSGAAKGHKDL